MQHVFITGGTGFIGSRLSHRLIDEGFVLTVLTRDQSRAKTILPERVNLLESIEGLKDQAPVDAIINLAGEPLADRRWNEARKKLFYSSRVGLTENLFQYFSTATSLPAVLISGSAIGYYGPKGDDRLTESATPTPCFSSDLCQAWESAACRFEKLGVRVCRIRTGIVLGSGGGALKAMLPAFKLGLGGPIGNGRQWMSWIHVNDMVEVLLAAIKNSGLEGPINATAPEPVTNREFSKTLGKVLSRPAILPMPAIAVRVLFGEMADELLLAGQRVVPEKLIQHGFRFSYPALEPALRSVLNRH